MKPLLCGAAERVITPRLGLQILGYFRIRKASAVKSDLKTHAIVLDEGDTKLAIIHIDILDFQASLARRIRKRLKEAIGISSKNVMIAATHTHTGMPSNYFGSVVTESAFSAGVYESKLSKYNSFLPPKAANEMADCAVKLLKKMK